MEISNERGDNGGIESDRNANIIHGHVLDNKYSDTPTSETGAEIKEVFKDSIKDYEDYLEICAELEQSPKTILWVNLTLRTSQDNCKMIQLAANKSGMSVNAWMDEVLTQKAIETLH
jgi:predicted HicB family RNase H-like nuclease